jgi:O-antigen biosynthesis protein
MLSHYHATFDVNDENNSHAVMLRMVGFNKRVLEAGCASGHMSEILHSQGCRVVGVEIDAAVVEPARAWLDEVVIGNFDGDDVWQQLDEEPFDVILFGDVLEHLRDPLKTLRASLHHLDPAGTVVISVPNIAHADVKIALMKGTFPYSESGLLDRTHISFFTKDSLLQMIRDAGLVAVEFARVTSPVFATEIGVEPSDVDDDVLGAMLEDRESQTYQFIIKAVPDNGVSALQKLSSDLVELTDKLYDETRRNNVLEAKHEALSLKAEALERQREADVNDLAHYRRQTDVVKRFLPIALLKFIRSRFTSSD